MGKFNYRLAKGLEKKLVTLNLKLLLKGQYRKT